MTRISDALHAAAGDPVDLDLEAVHDRVGRRRRHRARARAGACVVVALVAVGGIGLAAGAGDDGGDVRAAEAGFGLDEETTTTTEVPSSSTETTSEPATTSTEPPASTESTTTTEAPSITTTPPPSTTAPPAPTVLDLTWTYAGTEQWRLFQPQCPDLTHWLDGDATGSDGSAWTMRQDYCGRSLDGGTRWEGEGTLSLAGADGTLTGTMISAAPVPTTGVPFSWTIEDGTGAYAGATGDCTVTVFMTDAVFGRAHHEGTITCQVTLGGDGGDTEAPVPESV